MNAKFMTLLVTLSNGETVERVRLVPIESNHVRLRKAIK